MRKIRIWQSNNFTSHIDNGLSLSFVESVLFHFLNLCKTRFSAIAFRTWFHHVLPLKHRHLGDQSLFPNLCAVEHILGVVCSDEQQFLECSSVSIDRRLFKGNHGRFHLRCSTDIHLRYQFVKSCRLYSYWHSTYETLWNSSHLQVPTRFHKHTMQLVVEVPQNGLSTHIFWITFIVFPIGVILFDSCASISITLECLIMVIQITVVDRHNMNKSEHQNVCQEFFQSSKLPSLAASASSPSVSSALTSDLEGWTTCWFFHVRQRMLEDLKDHRWPFIVTS